MRNDLWLNNKLYELWDNNFADIPRLNAVLIKFGKKSKRQLGSIKHLKRPTTKSLQKQYSNYGVSDDPTISLITITSHFKDLDIPDMVVISTIAHELCHYTHGFSSPLPRLYNHPHKHGVIRKELAKRNLLEQYRLSQRWLRQNWLTYLKQH